MTRLRVLQTLAWINVAAGAFLACGSLLLASAMFASPAPDRPFYPLGLFVLIPLCMGLAVALTGRKFLKNPTRRSAVSAASGFAVLAWISVNSVIADNPSTRNGTSTRFIAGILFAYACFLALKYFVIKPLYVRPVTQADRLDVPASGL